jgi:hypothetical protein
MTAPDAAALGFTSRPISHVLLKLLAKKPEDRFASALELATAWKTAAAAPVRRPAGASKPPAPLAPPPKPLSMRETLAATDEPISGSAMVTDKSAMLTDKTPDLLGLADTLDDSRSRTEGMPELQQQRPPARPEWLRYAAAAGCVFLLLVTVVALWPEPANTGRAAALTGELRVVVALGDKPASGEVKVDGVAKGSAPTTVQLAPGMHDVTLTRGSAVLTKKIKVAAGETTLVTFEVQP